MNRRTFVNSAGAFGVSTAAAGGAPAAAGRKTAFYLLETYYMRSSTQAPRINQFMSRGLLPALARFQTGPGIFLEGLVASHMPQFVAIRGFASLDELYGDTARLRADAAYQREFAAWENGPEPPYEHYSRTILEASAYSPEIAPPEPGPRPRIFELRVYHSPTWNQLAALHERFAGSEIKIFHRSGVHPLLYSQTLAGPNMPNLTYLIPFDSLAAREKAWDAFSADPEWVKVRQDSIEKHGQISSVIAMSLLRATAYSPVR
jgi:hypothetical protein